MSTLDDLRRLLLTGRPAVPTPLPEPGSPSGHPAGSGAPVVMPLAGDGSPQLDSGIHMYQPQDVGDLHWTARYRRLIQLASGTGLSDYPATLLAAMVMNIIGPEDVFPEEILGVGTAYLGTSVNIQVAQLLNPAGSNRLIVIEAAQAQRHQSAGFVRFQRVTSGSQVGGTDQVNYSARDGRSSAPGVVGVMDGNKTGALSVGGSFSFALASGLANAPGDMRLPVSIAVLAPGQILQAFPVSLLGVAIVTEGLTLTLWTREVPFPGSRSA